MNFKTRPHFEDRQLVQYNNESIKLSGTTYIAPTILDFSASTSGQTTVDISGLVGYLNEGREYGLVVEPPLLKISGSTGYTTVDVTGYVLSSVDANGNVGWVPASGVTSVNIYNSDGTISNTNRSVTLNNSNLNITGDSNSIITTAIVSPGTSVVVSQLEDNRTFNGYVSLSGTPVSTGFLAETLLPKIESSLNYYEGIITGDRTALIVSKCEITAQSDEVNFEGIKYDVDYSNNYDPRSLVDKEYVDNLVSSTIFTGNTSGDCITDLYITNLYGCSPITVWDSVQSVGSVASGTTSFAFGINNISSGVGSFSEGGDNIASGDNSHAEGWFTTASGSNSHAEGFSTLASATNSHAEGRSTVASGINSHAEGSSTSALGDTSHAEGRFTTAIGLASHVQGDSSEAFGDYSHSGGYGSSASGITSFIHSTNSIVTGDRSVVLGGQNITGTTNDTVYVPDFVIIKSASIPTDSSDTVGELGSITWDDNYFYWKTSTGWLRVSGSTF